MLAPVLGAREKTCIFENMSIIFNYHVRCWGVCLFTCLFGWLVGLLVCCVKNQLSRE